MSITLKNVTFVYMPNTPYETKALDNISFEIKDGEFIGLIGHTGSGKSTLLQHLNGLLKPATGEALINGRNINEKAPDVKKLRANVGLVFQYPEYQLFEETVYKDVAFGPKNLGFNPGEIDNLVRESLELVEMDFDTFADKSPFELSGGQKRRIALAGILAMNPTTLILDEPMAGLDPQGRQSTMQLLRKMNKAGKTIIMVSHYMDDVAMLCERVMVMSNGKIVKDDSTKNIFADAEYLLKLDLDIPFASRVIYELKKSGKFVDDTINIAELADIISNKINSKKV